MNAINQILNILMGVGLAWALVGALIRLFKSRNYQPWMAWGGIFFTFACWLFANANLQTIGLVMMIFSVAYATMTKSSTKMQTAVWIFGAGLVLVGVGLGIQLFRNFDQNSGSDIYSTMHLAGYTTSKALEFNDSNEFAVIMFGALSVLFIGLAAIAWKWPSAISFPDPDLGKVHLEWQFFASVGTGLLLACGIAWLFF